MAAKALHKLAGPHLPASLTRLERALTRAHAYEKAERALREQQPAAFRTPSWTSRSSTPGSPGGTGDRLRIRDAPAACDLVRYAPIRPVDHGNIHVHQAS